MFIRLIYRRTIVRLYVICFIVLCFFIFPNPYRKRNVESFSQFHGPLIESTADINARETFSKFAFNAPWTRFRRVWSMELAQRYQKIKADKTLPPLKVFVLPHSHNDPGWIMTFQEYFDTYTNSILDNVVNSLTLHKGLKFVWSEICFLDLWWQSASFEKKEKFKKLVNESRLEIVTGGWVMTDEANVHLYAMLDQLIEGHQWVKTNLGISPKVGWSIDPFGQGSTVPHLLAKSGFDGAIIQRIHYNWKMFFAQHQQGDFYWKSQWATPRSSEYTLLTHNMPFDLYSIKHACGPEQDKCIKFNFCHVPGVIVENYDEISESTVGNYTYLMMDQYRKTASLFSHNVALILLGDDFAYWHEKELEQQFANYLTAFNYINVHSKAQFQGATIEFGTPSDYFKEIRKRQKEFPSFSGDFFPYADIHNTANPTESSYWTGFYTTRPFMKLLSRELEHNLRNAEILFTIGWNKLRQSNSDLKEIKILEKNYEKLIEARRCLGLFQHHDAITGTSKSYVMQDYRKMLEKSIKHATDLQQHIIEILSSENERNFIEFESERSQKSSMRVKKVINVVKSSRILLFNSLPQDRFEIVSLHVKNPYLMVFEADEKQLKSQINPIIINGSIMEDFKELLFVVFMPALLTKIVELRDDSENLSQNNNIAKIISGNPEIISIENSKIKLNFDNKSGFLASITNKNLSEDSKMEISFGAYEPVMFGSGAYLFKPEGEHTNVFGNETKKLIHIINGEISSEVKISYGKYLTHTVRIFNTETYLDDAISISNIVDFGPLEDTKMKDREMFMRINSAIDNVNDKEEFKFFTDSNSFQWQPRIATPKLKVEGNYYPITSLIFLQDETQRLSLITSHAQGATSFRRGEIEVMLERKFSYDDGRGLNEFITDTERNEQKFWLTLENFSKLDEEKPKNQYHVPSLFVHHLINTLNYPTNSFIIGKNEVKFNDLKLFNSKLPCDMNLVNLRTMSDNELTWYPSEKALLIFHRVGHDNSLNNEQISKQICDQKNDFKSLQFISKVKTKKIQKTSLTGLKHGNSIRSFKYEILDPMEIRTYRVIFQ